MQFSVGQNVMHPVHGAGEIVDVRDEELVEGFTRYYVIEFTAKKLTSHIPASSLEEIGVRKVMTESGFERVLDTLRALPGQLPKHFKRRKKKVEDMIQSGYPTKIAEAVRELTWREQDAHLTQTDNRFLSQAKDMLVKEMALATDSKTAEARRKINNALDEAIEAKVSRLASA